MDFNAGLVDGFVATMLVYVATLPLTCVSSSSVVTLALSMQLLAFKTLLS